LDLPALESKLNLAIDTASISGDTISIITFLIDQLAISTYFLTAIGLQLQTHIGITGKTDVRGFIEIVPHHTC
jgi:hypothetical protein